MARALETRRWSGGDPSWGSGGDLESGRPEGTEAGVQGLHRRSWISYHSLGSGSPAPVWEVTPLQIRPLKPRPLYYGPALRFLALSSVCHASRGRTRIQFPAPWRPRPLEASNHP